MPSVSKVYRPLDKLSDLFFAIGDAIHAAGLGVNVANYEEWDGYVGDATVLIELERTSTSERQNDGRYAHNVSVTLHAVVARSRKFAALEAANLATCLERLTDLTLLDRTVHGRNPENGNAGRARRGPRLSQGGRRGATGAAAATAVICCLAAVSVLVHEGKLLIDDGVV